MSLDTLSEAQLAHLTDLLVEPQESTPVFDKIREDHELARARAVHQQYLNG